MTPTGKGRKSGFWSRVNRALTEVGIEHFDDDWPWDRRVKLPAWQLQRLADRAAADSVRQVNRFAEVNIDAATLMRAYQMIMKRGVLSGGKTVLGDWTVETDHDGYGITLSDGVVRVRVLFHNRVGIESPSRSALAEFRRALHALLT
jgi:hypothetical protein